MIAFFPWPVRRLAALLLAAGAGLTHAASAQAPRPADFVNLNEDGWNLHQALQSEGGGVFVRGIASSVSDGLVTVTIAGTQGNLLSATFPVAGAPESAIPPISFIPNPRTSPLGDVPAYKWFNGVTFNGPIGADGTVGFANGYHGLLLETTNGGRTWIDLTDPNAAAIFKADIAAIALSPAAVGADPIAVAGSLSPKPPKGESGYFPPLHYATGTAGSLTWHISTILSADETAQDPKYYTEMLGVLYASSNLVLAIGNISPKVTVKRYPILYSIDAGRTFQPLADLHAAHRLREITYDSVHHLLWAASDSDGEVLRFDLSGCLTAGAATCKPSYVSEPLLAKGPQPKIYGLAVSPDGQTLVAVSKTGEAYYLADAAASPPTPTAWCANDAACTATQSPDQKGFTGEIWNASFLTDNQVMLVARNTRNSAASAMVFMSADGGRNWSAVPIDPRDWSVVQAPITGRLFPDSAIFVAPQGTLRMFGATITTDAHEAKLTPAMILGGTGVLGEPGVTIEAKGTDRLLLRSTLSGSGTLVKTGTGTLLLRPRPLFNPDDPSERFPPHGNYHAGGTIVLGGTLNITEDAALGVPSANDTPTFSDLYYYPAPNCAGSTCKYALTLDGGTLQAGADLILQTSWLEPDFRRTTAARQVILGADGGAIDTNGHTVTLPGAIAGPGGLTKLGAGTLLLIGQNTYAGSTSILAGTLQAGVSDTLPGTTEVMVAPGAGFDLNGHDQTIGALSGGGGVTLGGATITLGAGGRDSAFAGSIAGSGGLTKIGGGLLELSGTAVLGGGILVQQGALSVDGTASAATLLVMPQGALGGTGTIAAPTAVFGTLQPGDAPGTLTFAAPVTLAAGATLAVAIDGSGSGNGAGNTSRVVMLGPGGSFTAAGTLAPFLRGIAGAGNAYTPPLGQAFTIVQAQGGIEGSFDALLQPTGGLAPGTRFDAIYLSTTLGLVVTPERFADLGPLGLKETPNQSVVGGVLDAIRPASGLRMDPASAAIFTPIYAAGAALPADLDTLAGSIYGDEIMTELGAQRLLMDGIGERLDAWNVPNGTATMRMVPKSHGVTAWMTSAGQFSRTDSDDAPGFSGTTEAVTVGLDAVPRPNLLAGVAVGYANVQTTSRAIASSQANMVQGALYGSWRVRHLFADMEVGGGGTDNSVGRGLSPFGSHVQSTGTGWVAGGQLRAGAILTARAWTIMPMASLDLARASRGGVTETGDANLALIVAPGGATGARSTLGVRASTDIALADGSRLCPNVGVGWAHQLGATTAATDAAFAIAPSDAFSVISAHASRNAALLGGSLELVLPINLSMFVQYQAALGGSDISQSITGGLRMAW